MFHGLHCNILVLPFCNMLVVLLIFVLLSYSAAFVPSASRNALSKSVKRNDMHMAGDSLAPAKSADTEFSLGRFAFSLIPLSPEAVGRRKTIFTEVVKGQIWTLDQVQGIINVNGMFTLIACLLSPMAAECALQYLALHTL